MSVGLLALLDDVSILLDDTVVITKISLKKTAGLLGDDLSVNAKQASGFASSRELPVLWKITKGSLRNKIIILPVIFLLTAFMPWLISPVLILGGLYLAFEGSEKIHEFLLHFLFKKVHVSEERVLSEEEKVKSAIFTDFILSIEIIVIALSTVLSYSFGMQIAVVSIIALISTFGVYGLVALIVRMDDMGLYLIQKGKKGGFIQGLGSLLVLSLPVIVKILGILGTVAMLLVAGGIFTHNLEFVHHMYEASFSSIPLILFGLILGFIVGYILVGVFFVGRYVWSRVRR